MKQSWVRIALAITLSVAGALVVQHGGAPATARTGTPAHPHLYHVDVGILIFYKGMTVHKFNPDHLTIHPGDTVEWTNVVSNTPETVTFGPILVTPPLIARPDASEINPDVVQPQGGHIIGDVTQDVFSSGALMANVPGLPLTYRFTFPRTGLFLYRSLFHPSMLGEIDVVPARATAAGDQVDHGPTMFDALRSVAQTLGKTGDLTRIAGGSGASAEVQVGAGNAGISINQLLPTGLTVKVGSTIRWTTRETSGDLHALVFGSPTQAERDGQAPLYTGLAKDGGLRINSDYATPSLPSGTQVISNTLGQPDSLYTSGILYGSNVNSPSSVPSSYSLTFMAPAYYYYVDPFHPAMLGVIHVIP